MQEKISIIVPVYNAEKYIEETIACVQSQTYQNWELLLIDDCSMDTTKEKLVRCKDARVKVLYQQTNLGAAQARNRGVTEASGKYLAFLDADDIWKPEKLERQLAFMKEKKAAFVFGAYEYADEQGVGNGKIARVPLELNYAQALKNTIIFTSTVMFDTTQISKEKLHMPSVKSEDTALWWRILREGYLAYGLDEVLVLYRRPKKSLSSNKLEAIRRIWNLYRKSEGLSFCYSCYNFCFYAVHTVVRRL